MHFHNSLNLTSLQTKTALIGPLWVFKLNKAFKESKYFKWHPVQSSRPRQATCPNEIAVISASCQHSRPAHEGKMWMKGQTQIIENKPDACGDLKLCQPETVWGMSLKKVSNKALVILYFQEIRKKWIHWPGGQSAQRFYNCYHLCPCARPAHVGKCWPWPQIKFSKTVEV